MHCEPNVEGPLTVISSMATSKVLSQLADDYNSVTGQRVSVESVGGVEAVRRVNDGELFDVVVLASDALARLAEAGRVDTASHVSIARSSVAVAIKRDAPRPAIESIEALRSAILASRSVGYSTGPSGVHLERLFAHWRIADKIASRIVQARPGIPVASLIALGEVELGFQQLSELLDQPGIDILGPLPADVQVITVFSGAIRAQSPRADAGRALLSYLVSAKALGVKLAHGMDAP